MQKKWLSCLAGTVAVAAVWYGVAHGQPRHPDDASGWLAVGQTNASAGSGSAQVAPPQANAAGQDASNSADSKSSSDAGTSPATSRPDEKSKAVPSAAATTASAAPGTSSTASTDASQSAKPNSSSHDGASQAGSRSGSKKPNPPAPPAKNLGKFTIRISRDHGQLLDSKTIPIVQGESLMDYMHQYFQIETAYGDGFIVAINVHNSWIRSQWTGVSDPSKRQPVDWFLYVNGQQAPVGASAVVPKAGDVDVWDYHRWDPSTGK